MKYYKEKIQGKRLILHISSTDKKLIEQSFLCISKNRDYLEPWLPWVNETHSIQDRLKHYKEAQETLKKETQIEYSIFINKEFAGCISIFNIDNIHKKGELGYWISKEHASQGYMTEAVQLIEKEFFEELKGNKLEIRCDSKNKASIRIAEKNKYVLEGTLRDECYDNYFKTFRDTCVFSKLFTEWKIQQK